MNYRQAYLDLQKKHQDELSNFPIAYAFNEKQVEEALEKLGATKKECVSVFGHGDIVKRTDVKALLDMLERHNDEIQEMLFNSDFAEAAFLYEMDNHEYAINWSGDEDVMACFNLNPEKLRKMGLQMAWDSARRKHFKQMEEWGVI